MLPKGSHVVLLTAGLSRTGNCWALCFSQKISVPSRRKYLFGRTQSHNNLYCPVPSVGKKCFPVIRYLHTSACSMISLIIFLIFVIQGGWDPKLYCKGSVGCIARLLGSWPTDRNEGENAFVRLRRPTTASSI